MLPDLFLPMRSPTKGIRAILALALLILSAAPAMAQVTWRMTTEYPESNISGIGLSTFADRVAARTNGFVSVTNAFDNQLKISSGEMPHAALDGRIAGGNAFAGALSGLELAHLAHRTTENYVRMRDNGVTITELAPPSLVAALRTAATGTITAWEAQAGTDAAAIVGWAKQQ